MSFFDGFVQGAADQATGILNNQIQSDSKKELAQFNADLETQKAITLHTLKNQMDMRAMDAQRTAQNGRIDAMEGEMVQPAIDQKRGAINSGIEDQSNWTPEQQSAVDQSLALDKSKAVADPRLRTQAAIATGDIDPKTAATLTSQADIQQMKHEQALKDFENKMAVAKDKTDTAMAIAELRASFLSGSGAGGKAPTGYRFKEDGTTLEAIPGGPAAEGKPLNESQSKALLFGSRMKAADEILQQLASEGTKTSVPGSRAPLVGGIVTAFSSDNRQMLDQAKTDFMTAVLRRESGAAISSGEFDTANRQYFPQIGDSEKLIEQKAANRKLALRGVLMEGPAKERNSLLPDDAPQGRRATDNAPTGSDIADTGTKVSMQTQLARDKDRVKILSRELASAQQRLTEGDSRAQGDVEALTREIALTNKGMQRQGSSTATNSISGPKVGAVSDGYRFKGGNPADPKSWEKA